MRRLETLLITLGIFATGIVAINSEMTGRATATAEFKRLTDGSVQQIEERMQTYLHSLSAAAAFLSSSDLVTAQDFDNYVETLDIETFLPGINGIGFIEPVARGEEEAFLDRMAALGSAPFDIHPATDGPELFVISRISPLAPNLQALGLDISFETGRRTAATVARATGTPQLTPRILLVQDATKEPGFLLLRPLYWEESNAPLPGAPENGFRGWVYAPFIGKNLLGNLPSAEASSFEFSVFDGPTTDPESVIYQSVGSELQDPSFTTSYAIERYGRVWTVTYASTPQFERVFRSVVPLAIVVMGLGLTGMLVLSIRNIAARAEALSELAAVRTREISAREQENRALIENKVTGVLILDGVGNVLFGNQASQRLFGYTAEEMRTLHFSDLIEELHPPAHDHNAIGRTRKDEPLVIDLQCNEWVTAEGSSRMTALVRDLTEQHLAQKEIAHTKTSYDLALRGSQIGVYDIDLGTNTSEVSDTWRDIMGIAKDPSIDTQAAFLARVHPDDLPTLLATDAACIAGEVPRSISEFRVSFPDGNWRWMRSDAVVVERDENGKALRLIGTQSDVTDLRHARNALETSENRFRQVLKAAPIGMALLTDRGRFSIVNEAFCALVGRDEKDILENGKLSQMLLPEDADKMYHAVKRMVETGSGAGYIGEHRLKDGSGEERWGLFNVSWTYDANLQSNVYIAQVNDITDQKKIEQMKNEFVSTVSHELRTPLTSIKGALGLISVSEGTGLSDSGKRLIEIARSNTDRLTDIVNDILDLEKISAGTVSFDFREQDLGDLIRESVKDIAPFAITHKNTLVMDVPEDPIWVNADSGRTRQVLYNLISNACKYSDPSSEVTVKAERLDDMAIVYVQNFGPGVPDSFRSKIFGAFSQADSSDTRARGGTGLGLNISKQIVNRHNGEIGYTSIQDGVTVFWFTYPLSAAPTASVPQLATLSRRPKDADRLRVLHVEDDADFAEVVRSGLNNVADIKHVRTIAAARAALAADRLDVVVLDWSLPDGDAGCLLEVIETHQPDVRIVGLSADSNTRTDDRLYANLVKSRTDLDTIVSYVAGGIAWAS